MPRSPLIGRQAQLFELDRLFENARNGDGGMALLWGEAGVGKTRLLDEFSSRATQGTRIARTACFEFLCPPFAPLAELFAAFDLAQPFEVRDPESAPLRSETARYRVFVEAANSLAALAASPILLIVDDMQWADFATLEFLAFLVPRLAKTRILLLGAIRGEQLETDHRRREALDRLGRQGATSVTVPPLQDAEIAQLVSKIWTDAPADGGGKIERICALAEGKPYFAEELVNSAIMARGSDLRAPPLSIRAGVLARYEQLRPLERQAMLYASVIGRNFDASLLADVTRSTDSDIAATLSHARELQLVREIPETPGTFTFRHAITREILYREMLALEAQNIHREVAEHLERTPHPNPFDLAYHWRAAGKPERSSEAYERAGDAALARGANRDAEATYRDALETNGTTSGREAVICEKLQRALSATGDVGEACGVGERAVNAYVAAGETSLAAALAVRLARRIYESGRPAEAEATARRALQLVGSRGPTAYDAYVTLAHFEALQGRNDAALGYLAFAQSVVGEHSLTEERNAHLVRALVAATRGRVLESFEHYEAAVTLARRLHDAEQLAWTLNNYASRAMATGWMDRAMGAYREAARCLRAEEFGKVAATTIQGLAFAELLCGNLEAVRRRQEEDAKLPPGIAMTQTARTALGLKLAFYRGDDEEAAQLAGPQALELAFRSGETQRIGLLVGCIAAWYDATGRRDEAGALRSRALPMLTSVDFSLWLLDQLASTADARERSRARDLLADSAADSGNLAARAHLMLFDARVARLGRSRTAKPLADEAAARFEEIGWPWERAQALEIGGHYAQALNVYLHHGYLRHARALEKSRRRARHRAGTRTLTVRELEVARLAAQGKSNRAIAAELFIGERTVETHIAAIFDRFDLTSRGQLGALIDDRSVQGEAESPA